MSKKTYNATTVARSAKPRSKRMREAGYSAVTVIGNAADGGSGVSHAHANKEVLDALSLDTDRYLSATLYDKEKELSITEKIKAGYADKADQARHALNADDADKWDGNEFADYLDQSVRKGDKVRFEQVATSAVVAPTVVTPDFVPGGFAGAGAGLVTYANGQTGVEVDHIVARRTVSVNEVIINQAAHVGGRTLYSAANMECVRVVNGGTYYRCFFDTKNGQRANLWRVGDQAYCQRYSPDGAQLLSYYWRLVTSVGEDWINLSVTDCDGAGIPSEGDNIIQVGSRTDPRRQALLEIDQTNVGRVVQYAGINSFNFVNRNEVAFGVNDQGKPFFYAYGDLFVGDRDLSDADATYITFQTPEGETRRRMVVAADLRIGRGSTGLTNLSEWAGKQQQIDTAGQTANDAQGTANQAQLTANETARATQAVNDYVQALESDVNAEIVAMNKRLDGVIETFFFPYDPTFDNYPANEWTTDKLKEIHNGDRFNNTSTGNSWKWKIIDGAWKWDEITDTFEKELLNKIAKAQSTADGKMQSFVLQPIPPYSVGDSWLQGPTGDQMRCIRSRTSGVFDPADWDKASKYTDDTAVENLQIGGTNLYLNSNFNSADHWRSWTGAHTLSVADNIATLVCSEQYPYHNNLYNEYIPVKQGEQFIVSGEARSDTIAKLNYNYILYSDDNNHQIKTHPTISPEWNRVYIVFTVPRDGMASVGFGWSQQAIQSSVQFRRLKLERGNKPTGWSPAPEDVQADIDAVRMTAEQSKQKITDWASDSIISPVEKTGLRQRKADIVAEYAQVKADAEQYKISTRPYTEAYNAAIAALDKYATTMPAEIAVEADYDNIAAYYDARKSIMQSIDLAATEDVSYLKAAFKKGSTDITGGVVLSEFIGLKEGDNITSAFTKGSLPTKDGIIPIPLFFANATNIATAFETAVFYISKEGVVKSRNFQDKEAVTVSNGGFVFSKINADGSEAEVMSMSPTVYAVSGGNSSFSDTNLIGAAAGSGTENLNGLKYNIAGERVEMDSGYSDRGWMLSGELSGEFTVGGNTSIVIPNITFKLDLYATYEVWIQQPDGHDTREDRATPASPNQRLRIYLLSTTGASYDVYTTTELGNSVSIPKITKTIPAGTYKLKYESAGKVGFTPQSGTIGNIGEIGGTMTNTSGTITYSWSGGASNSKIFGNGWLYSNTSNQYCGVIGDGANFVFEQRSGTKGFRADKNGQWAWSQISGQWVPLGSAPRPMRFQAGVTYVYLTADDHTIIVENDRDARLYLPANPEDGKEYIIIKPSGKWLGVHGNGRNVIHYSVYDGPMKEITQEWAITALVIFSKAKNKWHYAELEARTW